MICRSIGEDDVPGSDNLSSSEVVFTNVWRRNDPEAREAAKQLWKQLGVLPPGVDPDARADELCVVAHAGDTLAAVCTAQVGRLESLREKFAMVRTLVAPEFRRLTINSLIAARAYETLRAWSLAHPEEALMGMGGIGQSEAFTGRKRPAVLPRARMTVVGWNARDERVRVAWFPHAQVGGNGSSGAPDGQNAPAAAGDGWVTPLDVETVLREAFANGMTYKTVWRAVDAEARDAAKAMWARLSALPTDVDPDRRADQLCVVGFAGGRAIGVCTVLIDRLPFLRARFAMLRTLVDPASRDQRVSRNLCILAHAALERWAEAHPDEEVMGTAVIIQNRAMKDHKTFALPGTTGLMLAGYTDRDERIRVRWFSHALV
jgi:hypothetical protein